MAWQSPSAMGPGGAAGDGNAQTGTEYTLQGRGCRYWHDAVAGCIC